MRIRAVASILVTLSAPALVAQGTPQGGTTQSLDGKWKACITDEGRVGCTTWEIKVKGDTFTGTDKGSDGMADQIVQGRIQGDHVSFKSGYGCTDGTMPSDPSTPFHTSPTARRDNCTVMFTGTYRAGEWTGTVDDTDNHHQKEFTATRLTGKS